jgi:Flp pilus assembly protein TadG
MPDPLPGRAVRRDDRGATTVEFALVVPLFLLLVGMASYFAWRLYTESQLERAAQRAARNAAIPTSDGTYSYRHCDMVDVVNKHLSSFTIPADAVTVSDGATTLPRTACPDPGAAGRPSGLVRVRVTHLVDNPFTEIVGLLTRRPGTMTISGTGEARVEDPT